MVPTHSNQLLSLLTRWLPLKDSQQWVLGIIVDIEGSSYRKPGAMMLLSDMGQQLGLLSGGCLEADIMRHAKMVMTNLASKTVVYDMIDEDNLGWQLGIGCGGVVKILLQPIHKNNQYLGLDILHQRLSNNVMSWYQLPLNQTTSCVEQFNILDDEQVFAQFGLVKSYDFQAKAIAVNDTESYLFIPITPVPHLAVFGAGIDTLPILNIAKTLGWRVSVIDERTAFARYAQFSAADNLVKTSINAFCHSDLMKSVNAVIIMHHNLSKDAEALAAVQDSNAKYIAVLGPKHRTEKLFNVDVLKQTKLTKPYFSPAGFDIGGELPESIALSILAQCHAVLMGKEVAH